jgi:aldose 1-epimerase
MSFEIQITAIDHFEQIDLKDTSNGNSIKICTKGGILNEWIVDGKKSIINGNDFNKGWGNFEMNGFKSGKMSPFSCRLKQGQYQHLDQVYTIEKFYLGEHALHGILYDAVYAIASTQVTSDSASVLLVHHYQGTDKGYPFPYTIQLEWIFKVNNIVTVKTTIKNQHDQAIPIMDGWHPYFTLGAKVNEYKLQFKNKGKIEYNQYLLPTGKIIEDNTFNESSKISELNLDDCWLIDEQSPSCTIQYENEKIIVTPISNYPYLQIYTPDDRMSIAIENLSAAPNCFNNKMGLHILKPQENWELATSYQYFID